MWYWFNYRLESDSEAAQKFEPNLPMISREQANMYPGWAPFNPLIRLIDTRTTYIMHDTRKSVFYAVFLDVFCLDPCPPLSNEKLKQNFEMARELLLATVFPEQMKKALENGSKFLISRDELLKFLELPYKVRAQNYENFSLKNFVETPYVGEMKYHYSPNGKNLISRTEDFRDVVYLPFEKLELPAPIGYERVLTDFYGDWHKMIITHTHSNEYSADIPYKEYFAKSVLVKSPPPEFS